MNSNVTFGYDFLFLMKTLELSAGKQIIPNADAAMQFFLMTWGITLEEVEESKKAYMNDVAARKIPDLENILKRIRKYVMNDKLSIERLLINTIAVAYIDGEINEGEANIIRFISELFEIPKSELIDVHFRTGLQLAFALNFFGSTYEKNINLSLK